MEKPTKQKNSRKRTRRGTITRELSRGESISKQSSTISTRKSSRIRATVGKETHSLTHNSESIQLASTSMSLSPISSARTDRAYGWSTEGNESASVQVKEARRHTTRSKTPRAATVTPAGLTRKGNIKHNSKTKQSTRKSLSIDACATMLAKLDERAYQRSILCDAHGLSREILQPMALPWMHTGTPVTRNIPCDIDEMTEILTADMGSYTPFEHGPFGFGRFDVGQLRRGPTNARLATSSDSWCAASRRTKDPGVIQLSSITLPLHFMGSSMSVESNSTSMVQPINAPADRCVGDISLAYFQQVLSNKRRRIGETLNNVRDQLISVKVNSSSSRSTIFCNDARSEKFLDATLPVEVQNGRFLTTKKAQKIASELGTYDLRHGLGPTNHTGKNANRLNCGRTRVMWTEKSPSDQPQRVFFTSLLSGSRVESGTQKRPREIKVALRVGGKVYGSDMESDSGHGEESQGLHSLCPNRRQQFLHPAMECVPSVEQIIRNRLAYMFADIKCWSGMQKGNESKKAVVLKPVLKCLKDADGILNVMCSSPGRIGMTDIHHYLNQGANANPRRCTVCWSSCNIPAVQLRECSVCGLIAHPDCCYHKGEFLSDPIDGSSNDKELWKCAVCCHQSDSIDIRSSNGWEFSGEASKKSKRKSRPPIWLQDNGFETCIQVTKSSSRNKDQVKAKCVLCPYSGGAMSLVKNGENPVWMHEVCRIWLNSVSDRSSAVRIDSSSETCALCGKAENENPGTGDQQKDSSNRRTSRRGLLIQCAAARCKVSFHPMCALLASQATSQSHVRKFNEQEEMHYVQHRGQTELEHGTKCWPTNLNYQVRVGGFGKDSLPMVFCGIHNPKRASNYRGSVLEGSTRETNGIPAFR